MKGGLKMKEWKKPSISELDARLTATEFSVFHFPGENIASGEQGNGW